MELFRRFLLRYFVDAARGRRFRKTFFEKEVFGKAVGNLYDVSFLPVPLTSALRITFIFLPSLNLGILLESVFLYILQEISENVNSL